MTETKTNYVEGGESGVRAGIFALNTAGANRLFLQPAIADDQPADPEAVLAEWIYKIRLCTYDLDTLNQLYTRALLTESESLRDAAMEILNADKKRAVTEGWLQVRVAGSVEWRQYYCVVEAGKKHQSPGRILFYADPKYARNTSRLNLMSRKKGVSDKMALFEWTAPAHAFCIFPEKSVRPFISINFTNNRICCRFQRYLKSREARWSCMTGITVTRACRFVTGS
jgi:hypothetical protein